MGLDALHIPNRKDFDDLPGLALFVGPNADKFVHKLGRAAERKWTWNWPAFFFGPVYLAYRKMYGLLALYAGAVVTLSIVEEIIGRSLSGASAGLAAGLAVSFYGQYWQKFKRVSAKAQLAYTDTKRQEIALTLAGDVSRSLAGVAALIIFILLALAFAG